MADQTSNSSTGLLGVIVGAAIVLGVGFYFLGGFRAEPKKAVDITITAPTIPVPVPTPAPKP